MRGNFYYLRLGKKISKERKKQNLSQETLAADARIDRTYLARIEEGKANPTVKVLYNISYKLKINMERLFKDV